MNPRVLVLSMCFFFLAVAAFDAGGAKQPATETVQPVKPVATYFETFQGRVEAAEYVELRSRVTGYLTKIRFKPGDAVKKGDVLFEIDDRPYRASVAAAESRLDAAEVQVQRLSADMQRAQALRKSKSISQEDFGKIEGDLMAAKALRTVTAAELARVRLDLDYTRISAPIDGKIGLPKITVGNLVKADDTTLAVIDSVDPVHVHFDVDERTASHLRKLMREGKHKDAGLPVAIGWADEKSHSGKIDFLDSRVGPKIGTIRCRAIFPNAEGTLLPGMQVSVRVPAEPRPAPKKTSAAESPEDSDNLKVLLRERHTVLTEAAKNAMTMYQLAAVSFQDVMQAQRAVFDADLDKCETTAERIELLRKNVKWAEQIHEAVKQRVRIDKNGHAAALQARALVLEAQIRLVREERKAMPPNEP